MRVNILLALGLFILNSCQFGKRELSDTEKEKYLNQGQEIVASSSTALMGQLRAALERGGVEEAVKFCSIAAQPITDSLSLLYDADLKRTSLRFRNSLNAPDSEEREVLEKYQKQFEADEALVPFVDVNSEGNPVYYSPIRIMPLCLQFHGNIGTDIRQVDYDLILSKYPNDIATGFTENDLRGMWSIAFRE